MKTGVNYSVHSSLTCNVLPTLLLSKFRGFRATSLVASVSSSIYD